MGLSARNGSNRRRTPFCDVSRNVECPSHVSATPRSHVDGTRSVSAGGNRIDPNYLLRSQVRVDGYPTDARSRTQARLAQSQGARFAILFEAEGPHAGARSPHRVRGGALPQHRRVLVARHRDVHDSRRHVHACVRLLCGGTRPTKRGRPGRTDARRECRQHARPGSRRSHVRRSR